MKKPKKNHEEPEDREITEDREIRKQQTFETVKAFLDELGIEKFV